MNHELDDLICYVMALQEQFPSGPNRPASLDMTIYWLIRLVGQMAYERAKEMELDTKKEAQTKVNAWGVVR